MYRYDEFDHEIVQGRVKQFRGQVERRLSGALSETQFKRLWSYYHPTEHAI